MYDELVRCLRADAEWAEANEWETPITLSDHLAQAADAIEELQGKHFMMKKTAEWLAEKVPKWIPVTERLPDENDRYLTVAIEPWFGTTIVDTMRWSGVWMYEGRQTEATITHWMPLPEPPKEE